MFGFSNGNSATGGARLVSDSVLQDASGARRKRHERIERAWRRYEGDYPAPLLPSDSDLTAADNTTVNLARKTVDVGAFYLFGGDIKFEVTAAGEEEPARYDEENAHLAACWTANRQGTMLIEFATGAAVSGDGFLRVYAPGPRDPFPRIVPLDSDTVDVDWEPDDYTKVRRFTITLTVADTLGGAARRLRDVIYKNDSGTSWTIQRQSSVGIASSGWVNVGAAEIWPYEWAPVFHCKNRPLPHSYYGASDIEDDVLGLNAKINFVLSNLNRVLRVHGHPQKYIAGQAPGTVNAAIDKMLFLPNPDATVKVVDNVTDLQSHFDQLAKLREAFHELTSIPEIVTGKMENIGQLSGLALKILYGPLVQLTEVKRRFYGEMLEELCAGLLEMGGYAERLPVVIRWPSIVPLDRGEQAGAALALQEAGVSVATTVTELGYDANEEAARKAQEGASRAGLALKSFNSGGG